MQVAMREVVRRNGVGDGIIYMQITRGVSPRNHVFPDPAVKSTLVMTARRIPPVVPETAGKGIKVITVSDIRWKRPDIKTVSLLPNVLAKQKAQEVGAYEAWQVDAEGYVTELGLDENDEIIGYAYVHLGKMMEHLAEGMSAQDALDAASGTYGRFSEAVNTINPRHS